MADSEDVEYLRDWLDEAFIPIGIKERLRDVLEEVVEHDD